MIMTWMCTLTLVALLCIGDVFTQESVTDDTSVKNDETVPSHDNVLTTSSNLVTDNDVNNGSNSMNTTVSGRTSVSDKDHLTVITTPSDQNIPTQDNIRDNVTSATMSPNKTDMQTQEPVHNKNENETENNESKHTSTSNSKGEHLDSGGVSVTTGYPTTTPNLDWMHIFLTDHHFDGRYLYNDVEYLFSFVTRHKHPLDYKTLVTTLYDQDGAVMDFNGTSTDGHIIVFTLARIYTPGIRFPLNSPLQITGSFKNEDEPYFVGNFTQPLNSSFAWIKMNRGLGMIETGETTGTRTAIIIIIPTTIAFISICGATAIICWASKKGYLRGRHKSYRLFTDAQVSYESEAETIHI
ncbi:hypothetical protein ACF0H5_020524 [Mactra antiquata]